MNNMSMRATSNLAMLEKVTRKLGTLNDEVVYLGGCATALFINDPLALDVRPTQDVDCIIDVISLGEYYKFGNKLKKVGFVEIMNEAINCRWHCEDMILDVMPTDAKILGYSNRWYKEALKYATTYKIANELTIKSVTAPYFLATKIDAFKGRGNNDLLGSHDFEDIITVIAGRVEIANEVALASSGLRAYLKQAFDEILRNDQFEQVLPGHVNEGPITITMQRVKIVKDRINKITSIHNE